MHLTSADQVRGARHLTVSVALAFLAWVAMSLQEVLLFVRPTAYGGPYVEDASSYFPYALFYNMLGVMLISAPAMLIWLVRYNRPVRHGLARIIHGAQLALLILTVALDHADNEVMRFMGIHLTRSLLLTYFRVNAWGSDMAHIFATDRGGPGLPFVILIVVPLALWWAGRRVIRNASRLPALGPWPFAAILCLVPLVFPLYRYNFKPMGVNRVVRVRPEIITLYAEFKRDLASGERPAGFESLARKYQERWLARSADKNWRFSDPERPLVRRPLDAAPAAPEKPWNVIYIQLETFRGWDTGFLRPDLSQSPTPFLDRLARDTASAFWRRHLSMGPPTVSGFVSGHCSIKPHSFYQITTSFTYTALDCLPAVLRRHGYAAEYFTGFDTDWDGETIWVKRWFDDFRYYKAVSDRVLFGHAAARIRELGRGSRPFMMTIVSASNHLPFRSPEPQFAIDTGKRPSDRIRNTIRYTDDVLREFIGSLEREPWYARTLVVITGDHGFDLGERGTAGQVNGWRQTVWVPLVIHGHHPRLPRGGRDEPASLLDIAPTIADLVGIRETNPWMGSSLLLENRSASFVLSRQTAILGEQGRFSMVVDPANGKARLYDAIADPLQRNDISDAHPGMAASLRSQAEEERLLTDYLIEANAVWNDSLVSATPPALGSTR